MELSIDFSTYTQWSGILTLAFLVLTILAFIFSWGIRFRLVGITSFMGVVTFGLFALSISLFTRTVIPGAVRYSLVYDNGANQTVIALPPQVTESEVEATLRQAANDLFSPGRIGLGDNKLTVRARTVIHPQSGISQPLYLGEAKRSLYNRDDRDLQIKVFSENLARLSTVKSG